VEWGGILLLVRVGDLGEVLAADVVEGSIERNEPFPKSRENEMPYLHIDNLYKNQEILLFKECYALEKLHGTSAHIKWKNGKLSFFAGGCNHERFVALFDSPVLTEKFAKLNLDEVVVYGEAYGGKLQKMSHVYGTNLRFTAFEVKINGMWLSVPDADVFVTETGLDFISYVKIPATIEAIDAQRATPSVHAVVPDKMREGIVLRPVIELTRNNGARIIAKHKNDPYRETKTKRNVTDPAKLKVLADASAIAEEWVTHQRLAHILDGQPPSIENMGDIIKAMIADIQRESVGEVIWSKPVGRAIGKKTAAIVKLRLQSALHKEAACSE